MFTKITINTIGKTQKEFLEIENHYLKQIKSKLSINSLHNFSHLNEKEQIIKESQSLISKIDPTDYLICLDINGESLRSEEFTEKMGVWSSNKSVTFIIGGSHGISDEVKKLCSFKLSFSKMTFSHQIAKILLLEQIYRAEAILLGKKYHK